MGRKNYLKEELSKEEKLYLKRIILTERNKYIEKYYDYINFRNISIDKIDISTDDSIVDEIIKLYEENMESEEKLHEVFSDSKLCKIIKALSLKEKKVLFYFLMKYKTIKEVSNLINRHERTVTKIRDNIYDKITDQLNKGGRRDV